MQKLTKELELQKKDQVKLVEQRSKLLSNLRRKNVITGNKDNYFKFNF